MDLPKISLVTPCYNAAAYIEQTIQSILTQDYPNLEYVIMDGGSTDGTVEIIKKYEDQLSYWVSEKDKGQSDAINKGITHCMGEYFNWINGDDYLLPGTLLEVGKTLQKHNPEVLCCSTTLMSPDGQSLVNGPTKIRPKLGANLKVRGLNQMGMFWKLDRIKTLKGVNTHFNFSMDLDLLKRYLLTFGLDGFYELDLNLAVFRLLEDSKTGMDFTANSVDFDVENDAALWQYARMTDKNCLEVIKQIFPEAKPDLAEHSPHSPLDPNKVKLAYTELFFDAAQQAFFKGEAKKCKLFLKGIDTTQLSVEEKKSYRHYSRWSMIKSLL